MAQNRGVIVAIQSITTKDQGEGPRDGMGVGKQ